MTILTNEEILKCVLGGNVAFEGYKRYINVADKLYEFHIRISGADAHKLTAHMISLNKKREEDRKPKPKLKTFKSEFRSNYQRAVILKFPEKKANELR